MNSVPGHHVPSEISTAVHDGTETWSRDHIDLLNLVKMPLVKQLSLKMIVSDEVEYISVCIKMISEYLKNNLFPVYHIACSA